ncbi:MAG: cupredoxin domain-containing protein [Burkholderiales bacterium]
MKTHSVFYVAALALSANLWADEGHHHHDDAAHHADVSKAGKPGKPARIDVPIPVATLDQMRYEPAEFSFKRGQTVKFIVTNKGRLAHEFGIGALEEQKAHAEMMKSMPDMKHDDPNVVTIDPGQTKELIWRFTKRGTFQIGCHVPGHYEAGMAALVRVR